MSPIVGTFVLTSCAVGLLFFAVMSILVPRKARAEPDMWISYYIAPRSGQASYLCKDERGGFYYSQRHADAHRFASQQEARGVTPVYDGSANIEQRTGAVRLSCLEGVR